MTDDEHEDEITFRLDVDADTKDLDGDEIVLMTPNLVLKSSAVLISILLMLLIRGHKDLMIIFILIISFSLVTVGIMIIIRFRICPDLMSLQS